MALSARIAGAVTGLRLAPQTGRFIAILAGFAVAAWLGYRDEYLGPVLVPLRQFTARAALTLIQALGLDAARDGTAIRHAGGFAYEISLGCMGVIPALFLAVGVLAWPGAWSRKLVALLVGMPLILGLNLLRLVHLFYVGVQRPGQFRFTHEVGWELGMTGAAFGLWLGITAWTARRRVATVEL